MFLNDSFSLAMAGLRLVQIHLFPRRLVPLERTSKIEEEGKLSVWLPLLFKYHWSLGSQALPFTVWSAVLYRAGRGSLILIPTPFSSILHLWRKIFISPPPSFRRPKASRLRRGVCAKIITRAGDSTIEIRLALWFIENLPKDKVRRSWFSNHEDGNSRKAFWEA